MLRVSQPGSARARCGLGPCTPVGSDDDLVTSPIALFPSAASSGEPDMPPWISSPMIHSTPLQSSTSQSTHRLSNDSIHPLLLDASLIGRAITLFIRLS